MNDHQRDSHTPGDGWSRGERDGRISRRYLLWLLGGSAGAATLWNRGWAGNVSAGRADALPSTPPPTLPEVDLGVPGTPTVAELAASLDWNIDTMFRYVTDDVRYDAYSGALRGATGTLWGRAGNSVDKTLLLAALLDEAAVSWRFAIGPVDTIAGGGPTAGPALTIEEARKRSADVLLPPDVVESWSGDGPWTRMPEVDELFAVARERVLATVALVGDALAEAGVEMVAGDGSIPADELERHVWLQYADGANWIDLDPSVTGAEAGTAFATPTETPSVLPNDVYHTVTVRVVAEVVTAGEPTRTELVTHQFRSADLAGTPVYVVHAPASWLGIGGAITGDQQYKPALLFGDEVVEGALMSLALHEGALDALGAEGDVAEGQTIAEWIEVDVTVPGGEAKQSNRTLFDRIARDKRESGNLDLANLPNIELVHIDDEIGDVFLPFAGAIILSIVSQPVPWSYFAGEPAGVLPETLIGQGAYGFDYMRDLCRLELLDAMGGTMFADEPSVTSIQMSPRPLIGAADVQLVDITVDMLHTHSRAQAQAADDGAATTASAGVLAGALDHAAERMLMNGIAGLLPAPTPAVEISVGRIFELAAEEAIETLTLAPGATVRIPDLAASAARRIDEALAAGRYVIIPARPVTLGGAPRTGWWEYDAATGVLLDRMDDGGRAGVVEYVLLLKILLFAACSLLFLAVAAWIGQVSQGRLYTTTELAKAVVGSVAAVGSCALATMAIP